MKKYYILLILIISTMSIAQNPIDAFLSGNNTFVIVGGISDGVAEPRDLDFHPTRENELWVLNKGGTAYSSNTQYIENVCVPQNSNVTFTIYDSYGDGICCSWGNGSYDVDVCGTTVASGGNFGSYESTSFNVGTCSDACAGDEVEVTITILTDNYGGETSWDLVDDDNSMVYGMHADPGGSNVLFFDTGLPEQTSEYRKDSFSGHFMHTASSMSFDNQGFFANAIDCQDGNNNSNGYFAGPTLWDADLDIYAMVNQNGPLLGSHTDMLHQSPYGVGIEYAGSGNVYWLFDGYHSAIVRYDFQTPHGYGGDNHSDGRVWRYGEVTVSREPGVPSHMVLDESTGWLYIADTGNSRIIRFNVNSGNFDYNLSPYGEPLAQYWMMENAEWEVIINSGLQKPSGIDIYEDRLIVGDFETGEIIIYNVSGDSPIEMGRFETGYENNLMGLLVDSYQNIYYVNYQRNEVIRVEAEPNIELTIEHLSDWNLVGLPLVVEDSSYETVYPDAISNTLYSFDIAGGYQLATNLISGEGYWLRFPSDGSNIVTGIPFNLVEPYLMTGWNLISGISSNIAVESIIDPSGIIVPGTIYGFGQGYTLVDELEPGKGYWIRANGDGIITIQSGSRKGNAQEFIDRSKEANTLVFTNAAGSVSQLNFGVRVPEREKISYTLPPLPPAGAFDVRFGEDSRIIDEAGEILIQNDQWPVRVQWAFHNNEITGDRWILIDELTGNEYVLDENNAAQISVVTDRLILQRSGPVPAKFALQQNYPNPFNPVTTIRYNLAAEAHVRLTIYDILGREIAVPVNGRIESGSHVVIWDAGIVTSGVYICQLETQGLTYTRKMILLR